MPLYIAQSGDLDRCYRCLTDSLTTLKDRATQLLIKYKSGALVTQFTHFCREISFVAITRVLGGTFGKNLVRGGTKTF